MTVVIKLARVENWDQVILASRALNADRALDREIAEVVKPRIRYAPEDPDRKAPWTYEADPFRTRKAKRQVVTPLSAPMLESAKERKIREKRELEQAKADRLEMKRRVFADLVDEAWTGDQAALLERLFPEATARELGIALESRRTAAAIISRACLLRGAGNTAERLIVAKLLGVTEERIRQLGNLEWRLASFLPKTTTGQIRGMH